jgi:hypothetical protein
MGNKEETKKKESQKRGRGSRNKMIVTRKTQRKDLKGRRRRGVKK